MMRKRVHALLRAPDGSAFQKCDRCGLSVAVALLDMHEYECRRRGAIDKRENAVKRRRSDERKLDCHDQQKSRGGGKPDVHDQPRSPFCFFMDSYMQNSMNEKWIEITTAAFESWVKMTTEEKRPFVDEAERVNSAYAKALLEEAKMISVDDEADSAMVGKFDPNYEKLSDSAYLLHREQSFDSFDLYISSHYSAIENIKFMQLIYSF